MKKLALKIFVLFCITSLITPSSAQALFGGGGMSIDPVKMMNQIMADLGVDKGELKNGIKTFNVSRTKKDAPTVKISFDPPHPIEGEIVTATAQPNSFLNDSASLYYTWYIKHYKGNETTEEQAVEAMGILARGDFNSATADYSGGDRPSKINPDDSNNTSGYKAIFGGEGDFSVANADSAEKNKNCFQHDFVTGDEYPIECKHFFPEAPSENTGSGGFTMEEEKFWRTNPNEQSTKGNNRSDEANIAGLGAFQFSWIYKTGDKISVIVEGTSLEPTQDKDASYKVMWATPMKKDNCEKPDKISNYVGDSNEIITAVIPAVDPNPSTQVKTIVETKTLPAGSFDIATFKEYTDTVVVITTMKYYPVCMSENQPGGGGTATCADIQWPGYPSSPTDPASADYPGNPDSTIVTSTGDPADGKDALFKGTIKKCMENNYVDPLDEGSDQKLDVSLAYGPKNPINNIIDPDRLIVSSTVLGSDDATGLTYSWSIAYAKNSADATANKWDLLSPTGDKSIPELSTANGVGLSDLKFNLALEDKDKEFANSKFYLKVKVDVEKKLDGNASQSGTAFVIIPVMSTDKNIDIYPTAIKKDSNPALLQKQINKRCDDDKTMEKILCPVVKNEIIGLEVPDLVDNNKNKEYDEKSFSWSVDGKKINKNSYGDYPSDGKSSIAYYPVLNELGNTFIASFSATKNDGQVLTLTRAFEVVDPKVDIVCTTNCDPELLGYYVNLDGTKEPDYSPNNFNVTQGATVSLTVDKNMSFEKNVQWFIDGTLITDASANQFAASVDNAGVLSFTPNKNLDESYAVSYTADYYQDRDIMKILSENHNVPFNSFYEKKLGDTVNLKVAYVSTVASANAKHKSLASLITNTSNYLNFLFRMVLTIGLFLFTTKIIFSLIPTRMRD